MYSNSEIEGMSRNPTYVPKSSVNLVCVRTYVYIYTHMYNLHIHVQLIYTCAHPDISSRIMCIRVHDIYL